MLRQTEAWGSILDALTKEFVLWKYKGADGDGDGDMDGDKDGDVNDTDENEAINHLPSTSDSDIPNPGHSSEIAVDSTGSRTHTSFAYTVEVYNIYTLLRSITIQRSPDSTSPALDLMRHGYLAKSPTKPTVAVSITTLELLYRLRPRKASFSIETFAKVVCDYYNVSDNRGLSADQA